MRQPTQLQNILIGVTATLFVGAKFIPGGDHQGPVLRAAVEFVSKKPAMSDSSAGTAVSARTKAALSALASAVRPLSHPQALETALHSYFAYKAVHADKVKKPYLYFVDYGLPSTTPRGYVFDVDAGTIVDGPFMVAAGRGSAADAGGVPTRFSNAPGSAATSLGLYLAQEIYNFHGKTAGRSYASVGLRLAGLSADYNDNARARGVVAHGAPYVTPTKAGRSEGCPAMEPGRAARLLPMIANGGVVFLFAPEQSWLSQDPWVSGGN